MKEEDAIQQLDQPHTQASLSRDLLEIGVTPRMTLLVHSSLSSLGWISGGAVAVVLALMDALTPEGTLVMPTHSGDLTDPCRWKNPPVPESWWQPIRDSMPAFHPEFTPSRGMGKIPEVFRTMPGVVRSNHPTLSFAAWGKDADYITNHHSLQHSLGDSSPLARVYDLNGYVLLLGVGYGNNTSFHLSEYRAASSSFYTEGSPIFYDNQRKWVTYEEMDWDDSSFEIIGSDYEVNGDVRIGKIGPAQVRLFPQRSAVDYAADWLRSKKVK